MSLTRRISRFWNSPWLEKTQSIGGFFWLLKTRFYYRLFFANIGQKSKVIAPLRLRNVHNIHIGENVIINKYAFLLTLQEDKSVVPRLTIGDGCVIGHMNHITCICEVEIGENVLTADRVFISDHSHAFSDTTVPILKQPIESKGKVLIGSGTWIGENVTILSCNIGRNCVIGANSVVLSDIEDYCVAVGAPARIIRRWNPISREWEKLSANESCK